MYVPFNFLADVGFRQAVGRSVGRAGSKLTEVQLYEVIYQSMVKMVEFPWEMVGNKWIGSFITIWGVKLHSKPIDIIKWIL